YSQAAQRDWHAPLLAVLGLLTAQAYPGRWGRVASALGFAAGLTVRPQVVLLLPAMAVVLADDARRQEGPPSRRFRSGVEWAVLYKPISPVPHGYLDQPLMLVWSINVAMLAHLALTCRAASPSLRWTILLLILGLEATGRPRFCNVERSLLAPGLLSRGEAPAKPPLGYTRNL